MLTIIYNTVKQAVENGDISALETWIKYGGNVNAENSEGTTFLQMAVSNNQLEVVKFLVKHGANVNAWKFLDKIPLTLSCKVGSLEIAEFLIQNGAEINPTDLIGTAPIHQATYSNQLEIVRLLLKFGANPNVIQMNSRKTPLHLATAKGFTEIVKLLLQNGAEINAKDIKGRTPLFWATLKNNFEVVKLLIDKGADVDMCQSNGKTSPLMIAVYHGFEDIIDLLIEKGANLNVNFQALHFAIANKNPKVVQKLLENGAEMWKFGNNYAPLHLAALLSSNEVCKILISHGACVNDIDGLQTTPLVRTVSSNRNVFDHNQESIVETLISSGANPNLGRGKWGFHRYPPLNLAIVKKKLPIIRILLRNGASLKLKDDLEQVPLETALKNNLIDVVKMLSMK